MGEEGSEKLPGRLEQEGELERTESADRDPLPLCIMAASLAGLGYNKSNTRKAEALVTDISSSQSSEKPRQYKCKLFWIF